MAAKKKSTKTTTTKKPAKKKAPALKKKTAKKAPATTKKPAKKKAPATKKKTAKKASVTKKKPAKKTPTKKSSSAKSTPSKKQAAKKPVAKKAGAGHSAKPAESVSDAKKDKKAATAEAKLSAAREKIHPGVDDFIGALAGEQARVSTMLRELIRQTLPAAEEKIRWGHPCWSAKGDLCYLMISGPHVLLGFFKGAILADTKGFLQGAGRNHRHIKVRTRDDIPAPQVKGWLREAARIERTA